MTSRHVTLTANTSNTAILIAPAGPPRACQWAAIPHTDATSAIEAEQSRRSSWPHSRSQLLILAVLSTALCAAMLTALYAEINTAAALLLLVFVGVTLYFIVDQLKPRETRSPHETDFDQVSRFLTRPEILTPCSVEVAEQLTPAQHEALLVAETYAVIPEVLASFQAQVGTKRAADKDADHARRQEDARRILARYAAAEAQYPTFS